MTVSKKPHKPEHTPRKLNRQATVDPQQCMENVTELRQTKVEAQVFRDGTLLPDLARQHHSTFRNFLTAQHGNFKGVLTWASMCSGSAGDEPVMSAVQEAFEPSCGKDLAFQQLFACENCEEKRKWIDLIINAKRRKEGQDPICIFCDVVDLGKSTAKCWVHQQECKVPDVNILLVSTHCKVPSRSSNGPKPKPNSQGREPPPDAYRDGLLNYLDNHHVDVLIYEDCENLGGGPAGVTGHDKHDKKGDTKVPLQPNHELFNTDMLTRGFQGKTFLLNSKLFGLPQDRSRLRLPPAEQFAA